MNMDDKCDDFIINSQHSDDLDALDFLSARVAPGVPKPIVSETIFSEPQPYTSGPLLDSFASPTIFQSSSNKDPNAALYFNINGTNSMTKDIEMEGTRRGSGKIPGGPTLGQMAEQVQARAKVMESLARGDPTGDLTNGTTTGDDSFIFSQGRSPIDNEEDGEAEGVCPAGAEATGRWTRLEHDLFLDALKKYGKVSKFVSICDYYLVITLTLFSLLFFTYFSLV